MDRVLINPNIVSGIADAIRAKKGTSSPIVVSDLANEIASIEGMPTSTKDLATLVGGATATDEISTNNDFAKGLADTPQTYTFKEQVTASGGSIKDTIAFVDKVKGNCVKYNQLIDACPSTTTINGITYTNNGDGTITANGTATDNSFLSGGKRVKQGHKYIYACLFNGGSDTTYYCYITGGNISGSNNIYNNDSNAVVTALNTGGSYPVYLYVKNGTTINNLVIRPIMVDLTEIGKEDLTTANELAQYYGYPSASASLNLPYQADTIVLNSINKSICSKDSNNVVLDNLLISGHNDIFPNGMQSNGTTRDEWDLAKGIIIKRIADDGTILATPVTHNVTKVKAYYKVSANGKEIAVSESLSAPLVADIAYRGMSAEDLINAING